MLPVSPNEPKERTTGATDAQTPLCEVCGHPIAEHDKRHGCNRIVEWKDGGMLGKWARACDCKAYPRAIADGGAK